MLPAAWGQARPLTGRRPLPRAADSKQRGVDHKGRLTPWNPYRKGSGNRSTHAADAACSQSPV